MSTDTLYWLFSTIAQTYGAILGIIGMLVVYRLQKLINHTEDCRQKAEELAYSFLVREVSGLESKDLVLRWEMYLKEKWEDPQQYTESITKVNREISRIKRDLDSGKKIRRQFKVFIFYHLIIIIASILALMYVSAIAPFMHTIFPLVVSAIGISSGMIMMLCLYLIRE